VEKKEIAPNRDQLLIGAPFTARWIEGETRTWVFEKNKKALREEVCRGKVVCHTDLEVLTEKKKRRGEKDYLPKRVAQGRRRKEK